MQILIKAIKRYDSNKDTQLNWIPLTQKTRFE